MIRLESGSIYFLINGVPQQRGSVYVIIDGEGFVGLRFIGSERQLVAPVHFSEWEDGLAVPYATRQALFDDLALYVMESNAVGIPDAPSDGNAYVRKDGAWVLETMGEAPVDGSLYARINAAWQAFTTVPEAPADGGLYARINNAWQAFTVPAPLTDLQIKTQYENNANTNAFTDADESKLDGIEDGAQVNEVEEAPSNGLWYVRRDGVWFLNSPPDEYANQTLGSPISTTSDVLQLALTLNFAPSEDPTFFEYLINWVWQSNDDAKQIVFELRLDGVPIENWLTNAAKKDNDRFSTYGATLPVALDDTAHTLQLYYANISGESKIITLKSCSITVKRIA